MKLITTLCCSFALIAGAIAADKVKEGSCCDKAQKAGKECAHPCCVKAKAEGKVCAKCNK